MTSGQVHKTGVLGWPVGHSLSPRIHGYWLERHSIAGSYEALAVEPKELEATLRGLPERGFRGVNVTLPHKEAVLALADAADDKARRIGAANTLTIDAEGRIEATNTDGYGFLENLRQAAAGWRADLGPAVVLGAGGAARAITAALIDAGTPEIRLLNRTRARAEALARDLGGISVLDWEERGRALKDAALLVNTTTLGMVGNAALDLDLGFLPTEALVNDIVYRPLETPLLAAARGRGNPAVDGLGMLLHQARPGFAAWWGVDPEVTDALRRHVLAAVEPRI